MIMMIILRNVYLLSWSKIAPKIIPKIAIKIVKKYG